MKRALIAALVSLAAVASFAAGDTFDGFAVDCSTSAWSTVRSARSMPRRLRVQILDSSPGGVCLSTTTTSGQACDDSTVGVELSTGTAKIVQIDLLTKSQINCRGRAGIATQKIKGYEGYDSQN